VNPAGARDLTVLFTDIEGSTRLWETQPSECRWRLARHDAICRDGRRANARHGGEDDRRTGMYAVFDDAANALDAAVALQAGARRSGGHQRNRVQHPVRHATPGEVERRDSDYFGSAVNSRSARHGRGARRAGARCRRRHPDLARHRLP
jgi:class 3 adenylate cyclase